MDNSLQIIDLLLKYVSIIFLIYCCLNSLYNFYYRKPYRISDFRIYLMTLIFIFFKLSASFLTFYSQTEFNYTNLTTFIIVLIGFYLHNKIIEPRKKFFRVFIFYLTGLLQMIYL